MRTARTCPLAQQPGLDPQRAPVVTGPAQGLERLLEASFEACNGTRTADFVPIHRHCNGPIRPDKEIEILVDRILAPAAEPLPDATAPQQKRETCLLKGSVRVSKSLSLMSRARIV